MADQDDVTQGAIPPKVSPFAKPEAGAPTTPAAPGAPRPITVRLKPVAAAPAAEAPAAAVPAATPAVGIPAAAAANPRATSRVPVPEAVAPAAAGAPVRPMTVRLRPVAAPVPAAGSTQSIAVVDIPEPVTAPVALQPQSPPTPGANPLPAGPKPPSAAQTQAAKSKTSRISLDSAIGVAPVGGEAKDGPKTIRLKRPTDLAAPTVPVQKPPASAAVRQTSRIPDSALPTAAEGDSAAVTQKKTLKIKRPGAAEAAPEAAVGGEGFPEGVQMTPISAADFDAKEESSVFTAVSAVAAIAAAVVVFALMWMLMGHAVGSTKGPNALAFMEGPDLPCPGRIIN